MSDERPWDDYPVCPPCLLGDHDHCDGGLFWCTCIHESCLDGAESWEALMEQLRRWR